MNPFRPHPPTCQLAPLVALLTLAAIGGVAHAQPQPLPPPQQRLVQPNPTLVQKLRRLFNLAPPLAVGGSRSGSGSTICLLSPWPTLSGQHGQKPLALVPTATPTLLSSGPLNEVQLLREDRIVWELRATSSEPIIGPIHWPITPLQAGEQMLLRLRPWGAAGADFAEILLQAAEPDVLAHYRQSLIQLLANPNLWLEQVGAELARNPAQAIALVTDPAAPFDIRESLLSTVGCGKESP